MKNTAQIFPRNIVTMVLLSFLLTSCTQHIKMNGNDSVKEISYRIINNLLHRHMWLTNTSHQQSVHYAEACTGFGAARLTGLFQDTMLVKNLTARYMHVEDSITNSANHVDANVYGILPLELYQLTGNNEFLKQGLYLADSQWDSVITDGLTWQTRFWIDDVWMIGSLQTQAYRVTGNEVYLNRAAHELNAYIHKLQQENGLFYHGENAPFYWGRGNGWVAAGLAELLSELPASNQYHDHLLAGYLKMMDALCRFQGKDGMWLQLIDKEESWKETSSTAMFGYALCLGVKNGLLTGRKYKKAYKKAWNALINFVNENGEVTEVCQGTGKKNDMQYYLDRPRITGDLHGQAPVLWFAWVLLK